MSWQVDDTERGLYWRIREVPMAEDEPQPIDHAIEHLVVVMLHESPSLDRQRAHDAIRGAVEDLIAESESS
jgi:hypothetical protein